MIRYLSAPFAVNVITCGAMSVAIQEAFDRAGVLMRWTDIVAGLVLMMTVGKLQAQALFEADRDLHRAWKAMNTR